LVFLEEFTRRTLSQTATGLAPEALFIGPGNLALEVALFRAISRPTAGVLQAAWQARRGARATPVLVIAIYQDRAWLCGPTGETLPVFGDKDLGAVERVCAAALRQSDRHAALIFLAQSLPSLDTPVPGIRNEGLFALHELTSDVSQRPGWRDYVARSRGIVGAEGQQLLTKLGYSVERLDNLTLLLRGGERRVDTTLADVSKARDAETSGASFDRLVVAKQSWMRLAVQS
jgi:hypothetical protein